MTTENGSTIPDKNIRFCPDTRDYEIRIDGQIIGYAPTHLRGYEIANEFVYLQLTATQGNPADCVNNKYSCRAINTRSRPLNNNFRVP